MNRRKLLQSIAGIGGAAAAGTAVALSKDKVDVFDWRVLPPISELEGELVTFWQGDDHSRGCVIFYAEWIHGSDRYAIGHAVSRQALIKTPVEAGRLVRMKVVGVMQNTIKAVKYGTAHDRNVFAIVAPLTPEGQAVCLI